MGTSDTRHQELTELLDSASEDMPYKVGSLTAFEVKNSYWQRGLNRKFGGLEPSALDSNVRAALEEWVRCLLGDYFIPGEDAILPVTTLIVGGTPKQSVKEFVDQLRVASAVLGGARVATLLLEWAQGKPICQGRGNEGPPGCRCAA